MKKGQAKRLALFLFANTISRRIEYVRPCAGAKHNSEESMHNFLFLIAVSTALTQAGTISTTGQDNARQSTPSTSPASLSDDLMAGMVITGSITADCIWASTGGNSGGCSGTYGNAAFSMSLDGDTFSSDWFLNVGGGLNLTSLFFNGLPGNTVFRPEPKPGTDGSASGFDAAGTIVPAGVNGIATYIDQVATLGNPPQGDIFARVRMDFSGDGPLQHVGNDRWWRRSDRSGKPPPSIGTIEQ
jgi:hypothetical protein